MPKAYEVPRYWRSRVDVVFAMASLAGAAVPFLPFAYATSPLSTLNEGYGALVGAPFFATLIVSFMLLRIAVRGSAGRLETLLGGLFAGAVSLGFVLAIGNLLVFEFQRVRALWLLGSLLPVGFGLLVVARLVRARTPAPLVAVAAMQLAFISVAGFWLEAAWPRWQVGAIVSAVTVVLYVGQTLTTVVRAHRRAADGEVVPTGGRT